MNTADWLKQKVEEARTPEEALRAQVEWLEWDREQRWRFWYDVILCVLLFMFWAISILRMIF